MFIRGVGRTKFGVLREQIPQLMYEAILNAKKDAKISVEDIDACIVSNFFGGTIDNQSHLNSLIASLLPGFDKQSIRVESACASGGAAFNLATKLLNNYENVLVVGVEKMTNRDVSTVTDALASAADLRLEQDNGLTYPAAYALIASEYFDKYGVTHEALDRISLKNHENANKNPLAHFYHKKVTLNEIKESPVVCSPLRLFDCSPISDGAAAVILSATKSSERDVEILSSEMAVDTLSITQREDIIKMKATEKASKMAFNKASIKPNDISLAEIHDCFTINELVSLESIGFCKFGKASDLNTSITGEFPVNTDGGLKADGHPIGATGVAQITELVTQLRGEAGDRQVKKRAYGLAHNIGGSGGSAVVTILKGNIYV
ncbi:MAG: thiolase domain-containing protein [Candidatus Aenigmarchaeota archaeon]|nr:thiolase domain-containing protein [Candidatus Aenigmarchaeota archaeon]